MITWNNSNTLDRRSEFATAVCCIFVDVRQKKNECSLLLADHTGFRDMQNGNNMFQISVTINRKKSHHFMSSFVKE